MFRSAVTVCELIGVDIATYMFETDYRRNAVRDAAATVLAQRKREEEAAKARQQRP